MSSEAIKFGMPMLQALGIDASEVLGFTIRCEVGEFPTISITKIIPGARGEAAASVLQLYRLELVEEVDLPSVDVSTSLESTVRTTNRVTGSPAPDRT